MRKIYSILIAAIITVSVFGQAPEKMSYQAVIRDINNNLVSNQQIGMQFSILQGSTSGIPVYVETQMPITNANGLVTLEIGGGTVVSGDFSTIDWANNIYFIKVETDPAGGTNYTISSTGQLLSVPYALHSKTTDFTSNTPDLTKPIPLYFKGGIIYVHPTDNADTVGWGGYGITTGATSTTDGQSNTTQIVNLLGPGYYAAYLCDTLTAFGFTDWYLPSIYELDAIQKQSYYLNLSNYNDLYWSSTEVSDTRARAETLYNFGGSVTSPKTHNKICRCIRK